jgi:hypothetical protein
MKPTLLHGRILAQGARREKQTRRDPRRRAARCRRDAKVLLMISTVLIKVSRINKSTGKIPLHNLSQNYVLTYLPQNYVLLIRPVRRHLAGFMLCHAFSHTSEAATRR